MDIIRWLATEPGWTGRVAILSVSFAILEVPFQVGGPAMLLLGFIDATLFPKARR